MTGLISQLLMIIVGFFARKAFLIVLDAEYLGVSGLFSSVLTMLSLAELGIGPAMIFSLYKPLAEQNIPVCRSLMRLYKKAYLIIGSVVLGIGLIVSPFITGFIKDIPEQIEHIHWIFLLFVVDTAISYFFSYKRSLIIASQSYYEIDIAHTTVYILRNIIQIIILFLTGNYFLFLLVQILSTVSENIWLSQWANKKYSWLSEKKAVDPLSKDVYLPIVRNVKAMIFHRIGGVVVDSIDNLLISYFFGVLFLGLYSNYLLVIDAVKKCVNSIFSAVSASIGDFGATEDADNSYLLYRRVFFINFWIAAFCATCIYILLPPFIGLFFGEEYRIDHAIFVVIALNFYIECMRRTILTFKESFGLPWYDRYKPLVGATVNLVTSIILSLRLGVIGVFIGTTITQLCVNVWVEAKVVFNHAFQKSFLLFFRQYLFYGVLWLLIVGLTQVVCSAFSGFSGIYQFILSCLVCLLVPNLCVAVFLFPADEMKYFRKMIRNMLTAHNS